MEFNEGLCDFMGHKAQGSWLEGDKGAVYIIEKNDHLIATKWNGELISANVRIVSEWNIWSKVYGRVKMRHIRFNIDINKTYSGRYNTDTGQLCRVKRLK
jgi:hypothetical protein